MSQRPPTKKLINDVDSCVDDNLRGLIAMYPQLHLHPKNRLISTRRQTDTGRVAVLGGGGSGHEPFAAGQVGPGMLDAAVAGGIFASPPTGHVLYGIAQLYKYHSGGVLVVIGNYTGDRLNFGKAIEKAKIAGIKVEGLIVGEDVASSHNKTGGRSMCGEVYFYKLCGGLASEGYDLATIKKIGAAANKRMATLGVCMNACSLPGQPPLFEIALDEMELGAGVHGEAGIKKMKFGTAAEVVAIIIDKIIEYLKLVSGDRVAVLIDNLGSTSFLEMNIISAETKSYLSSKGIKAERIFAGHVKTSLEMHGIQICVLHLDTEYGDLWLKMLDKPTDAAGWVGGALSIDDGVNNVGDDDSLLKSDVKEKAAGPSLNAAQQKLFKESLRAAIEDVVANEELLNKLDSGCGDGDCGITMKKFAKALWTYAEKESLQYPSDVMWQFSEIAEKDMGGTSGGIYSLALSAASQALTSAKTIDRKAWLSAWEGAMAAITKYAGAEPGDRTMLDTLHAASLVFKKNLAVDMKTALISTAKAAEDGAKATISMKAGAGRAAYVSNDYMTDEDAGARAVAVWISAICNKMAASY